jgi:hypothetical protein
VSRRPSFLVAATVLLASSADHRLAWAAECGATGHPWVQLIGRDEVPANLTAFVGLLGAELASRGIDLCPSRSEAAPEPLATVKVSTRPDAVALSVEVHDAVTAKQVSRDVALTGVPRDSQPLTVALAADELLRASWAELALQTAPPPALPVPPQVTQTVHEALTPAPPGARARVQLGVGFVWEQYSHGVTLYGADARLGAWWGRRFETALQFGLRTGPTATATDGAVQPSAWSLGLAGIYTLTPVEDRWGLDAVAVFDVERLTFVPTPAGGATGSEQSGFAALASLGPQAWFAAVPALRLGAEALAAIPLRGVDAADARVRFAGIGGIGWVAQLGVWSGF